MATAFAMFGIAFAGFCVWLTVRIVNRRERWAKRTAVSLITVLVATFLYVLSSGPAIYLAQKYCSSGRGVSRAYRPVFLILVHGPKPIKQSIWWYLDFWRIIPFRLDLQSARIAFIQEPEYHPSTATLHRN